MIQRLLYLNPVYNKVSDAARYNRQYVEKADKCGYYGCLAIFNPEEITEWCDEGDDESKW